MGIKLGNIKIFVVLFSLLVGSFATQVWAAAHPSLFLTEKGVTEMRAARAAIGDFDAVVDRAIADAHKAMDGGIVLPEPKDGGGGYSHEKHKDNYYAMYYCGLAYQLTAKTEYAQFVADMLTEYAKIYRGLGYHPVVLSKTPGRLFWQTLNECVWLIHASIAYDCVYEFIPRSQRERIETDLLRPMAEFIMDGMGDNKENNVTFNKMHNHATWATTAVAMVGFVTGDDDYVQRALYGSDRTGRSGGFIMQLDKLFSPDGYFTEGAYYQRYSIWPFMLLAQAINNNLPKLDIFNYRDRILEKALDVLLQLAYDGQFMTFNDSMEKGYDAQEVVCAVDVIYNSNQSKKQLLDVAQRYQQNYLPTDAGYTVARDIALGQAEPIEYRSVMLRDGAAGDEGGFAIIRNADPTLNSALTLKATAHGLSHGHYDKLNIAYYDNGNEIIQDYGAARFHNIEAKYKGHYTPENKTFAMASIAHNTVTVDEQSHFEGNIAESSKYHSDLYLFDAKSDKIQVVSAVETNAYKGVDMHRTVAYLTVDFLQYPLILDIFRLKSKDKHQYDYPIYYNGHMISLSFEYEKSLATMNTLGDKNGYQHLWTEAHGKGRNRGMECFTWFIGNRFYSVSTAATPQTEFYMVRAGANDPNFNIRPQAGYIVREKDKTNHTFVSAIETHGTYNTKTEQAANIVSSVEEVVLLVDNQEYTVAQVKFKDGSDVIFCLSNIDNDTKAEHKVEADGKVYSWRGAYNVMTTNRTNQNIK